MTVSAIGYSSGALSIMAASRQINADIAQTTQRLSTKREINSYKDNPALYASANAMRSEAENGRATVKGLQTASAAITSASKAVTSMQTLSKTLTTTLKSYTDGAITASEATATLKATAQQLNDMVNTSSSGGLNSMNLLDGGGGQSIVAAVRGGFTQSSISIGNYQVGTETGALLAAVNAVTGTAGHELSDEKAAIESAITATNTKLKSTAATLSAKQDAFDIQIEFETNMADINDETAEKITGADMQKEAIKLQQQQTQQALISQMLADNARQEENIIKTLFNLR